MPAGAVRIFMDDYIQRKKNSPSIIAQYYGERYLVAARQSLIRLVAATFVVSGLAAEIRLKSLGYINDQTIE
jgi:hypothetical protein